MKRLLRAALRAVPASLAVAALALAAGDNSTSGDDAAIILEKFAWPAIAGVVAWWGVDVRNKLEAISAHTHRITVLETTLTFHQDRLSRLETTTHRSATS